jgi:hypothetical protein
MKRYQFVGVQLERKTRIWNAWLDRMIVTCPETTLTTYGSQLAPNPAFNRPEWIFGLSLYRPVGEFAADAPRCRMCTQVEPLV